MKIAAIVLIAIGILALTFQAISFTREEKVVDLGPIEASVKRQEIVPLPPLLGVTAIVAGTVILVLRNRRTA